MVMKIPNWVEGDKNGVTVAYKIAYAHNFILSTENFIPSFFFFFSLLFFFTFFMFAMNIFVSQNDIFDLKCHVAVM